MAILHGSWLTKEQDSYFFIWGEIWRSFPVNTESITWEETAKHPLVMTGIELQSCLSSHNIIITDLIGSHQVNISSGKGRKNVSPQNVILPSQSQVIALPSQIPENLLSSSIFPLHSAALDLDVEFPKYLQPWQVEGFCLPSSAAIKFLTSLPLNFAEGEENFLGGDLRFWSQIARWSLDLISRSKFLPTLGRQSDHSLIAKWQVLLDSAIDSERLERFAAKMPLACRTYQPEKSVVVDFPLTSQALILDFLNHTVDAQMREMLASQPPSETKKIASLPSTIRQWLQALTTTSNLVNADAMSAERLAAAIKAWTLPLAYQLAGKAQFRTCFQLRSPELPQTNWRLAYFLQAVDDPEFYHRCRNDLAKSG